jgi:putative aldouronate transport system substrate-binding protein
MRKFGKFGKLSKLSKFRATCVALAAVFALQLALAGCGAKTGGAPGGSAQSAQPAQSSQTENSTQSAQTEQTEQPAQPSQTEQQPAEENPAKDFVTVSWYMRKPIDTMKDQELVEAEANKIIKEKINANLEFTFIDTASWEDKMKMMSAAGEEYDIVFTTSWTNRLDMNVQRGAFKALDELLDEYGQSIKNGVDPRAWKAATYSGKIMAIPAQAPFSQPKAFVFKKDLVEKYNFDYKSVSSLEDLEPYLETIKKNEPNMVPLLATAKNAPAGYLNFDEIGISKGIAFNEKTGRIELSLEIPETVSRYKTINEYYKKGYIAKDASTKTDTTAEGKSGKYAVMIDMGGFTEDGSKSTSSYGFPCVEALYGYPMIFTGSMVSAATAISNTSKNPERAMMLLDLVWSDKTLLNTLAYGIEGKNYTVTAGKGTDSPTVVAASGAEQTWAVWHNWMGPLWDQWDSNWNTTAALEKMRDDNEKAKTSAILGFLFDNEPVKSEIAQISAVYAETELVLNTGVASDFDKYVAETIQKLKDAGIDKVMAEAERQCEAWKAANE